MCPSAPRVCSEPGGQKPVLSLSLDLIRPSLVQIITCHYLTQWCIIVNQTLINKLQSNCIQNSHIFIQENAFENVVWKMSAIMSRPQCANLTQLRHDPKQMDCLQSKVFWMVHPQAPLTPSNWSALYRGRGSPVMSWILLPATARWGQGH